MGVFTCSAPNRFFCCLSASYLYYWCVNAINCTGKNMSEDLLYALGEADANMFLCSKEVRPGETDSRFYLFIMRLLYCRHLHTCALVNFLASVEYCHQSRRNCLLLIRIATVAVSLLLLAEWPQRTRPHVISTQ